MSSTNDTILGLATLGLTVGLAGEIIESVNKKKKRKGKKKKMEIF